MQVGSTDLCELVNLKGGHYLKEVSLLRKPVHLFIAVDVLYRRAFSGDIFPRQFKMAEYDRKSEMGRNLLWIVNSPTSHKKFTFYDDTGFQ